MKPTTLSYEEARQQIAVQRQEGKLASNLGAAMRRIINECEAMGQPVPTWADLRGRAWLSL